jgi:hypothetical protein
MVAMIKLHRCTPGNRIKTIGVHNVLVESYIPHSGSMYPGFRQRITSVVKDLDPYIQQRVLQDNASALYRISLTQGESSR